MGQTTASTIFYVLFYIVCLFVYFLSSFGGAGCKGGVQILRGREMIRAGRRVGAWSETHKE